MFASLKLLEEVAASLSFRVGELREVVFGLCCCAVEWKSISGRSHFLPLTRFDSNFDAILRRDSITKLAVSISRPLDALNRLHFRKLDLHPAFSSFVGNPAPRIAAAAIVEMFQLVNFITWQCA